MSPPDARRRAGLLIPLFSCPSTRSWGIGDIGDLGPMTRWLAAAGQRVLQLLPLNEMAADQQSPYSALSAMAIDPVYICLENVPDLAMAGREAALPAAERELLASVRSAARIDYTGVRRLKRAMLARAFEHFHEAEWSRQTGRARALGQFVTEQAWWVEDYALFRALHAREGREWTQWSDALQRRDPGAIDQTRHELRREILFYQYLQWIADSQWQDARAAARRNGVELFGDLPFMVDGDSADVWSHQRHFRLDASIGVPPDAFSPTGQDWGMPVYDWASLEHDGYGWLRDRARRSAALYDGYRVDHVVGFFRTYAKRRDNGKSFFTPSEESQQIALGECLVDIFCGTGSEIIAEDLGTIPDFVRASLARKGVPGICVMRWEREWDAPGQPFRDMSRYPTISVAASGTHDTEPLIAWWESASSEERANISALPTVAQSSGDVDLANAPFVPVVRDRLVESMYASRSNLVILPIQDVFGWRDRINRPATITADNWTFRLPWPCDRLDLADEARERQATLHRWASRHGR